jgi:hypothetical protein
MKSVFIACSFFILCFISCTKPPLPDIYTSQKVIIVIVDGARYSETWGEPTKQYIPYLTNEIASSGVIYTNFYNKGPTYTMAGHTAISTGNYQLIPNDGADWPQYPSIFQAFNSRYESNDISWIITSKDKLEALAHCQQQARINLYSPMVDAGIDGQGSGYRHDSITLEHAFKILSGTHPYLVLISFREPDYSAHKADWNAYIDGIKNTDLYVHKLWEFIQNDSIYKGTTTLMITNDHGRHLDNVADGFASHGDTCEGCRHICFIACGPNIKRGQVIETERELLDIPTTIAKIMGISFQTGKGVVMSEMFNEN